MANNYKDCLIGFHADQVEVMDKIVARKHTNRSEFVRQAVQEKIDNERNRENFAEVNAVIEKLQEEIKSLKQQIFDLMVNR